MMARKLSGDFRRVFGVWKRRFDRAGKGPGTRAMRDIGSLLADSTEQRMNDQVEVSGKPLAPLSPAYLLWKQYGTTNPREAMHRAGQLADLAREAAFLQPKGAYAKRQRLIAKWSKGKGPAGRRGGYSTDIWQLTGASKMRVMYVEPTEKTIIVKINTPYSGYVNDGTARMPARPVLGISRADRAAMNRILELAFTRMLAGGA